MELNRGQTLGLNLDMHIVLDAGAGTGKTACIVQRVLEHYLSEDQRATRLLPPGPREVDLSGGFLLSPTSERENLREWKGLLPTEVVVLTFTVKAAQEMRDRLRSELARLRPGPRGVRDGLRYDPRIRNPGLVEQLSMLLDEAPIGTIDSFLNRLVASHRSLLAMRPTHEQMSDAQRVLLMERAMSSLWRISDEGHAADLGVTSVAASEFIAARNRLSHQLGGRARSQKIISRLVHSSLFVDSVRRALLSHNGSIDAAALRAHFLTHVVESDVNNLATNLHVYGERWLDAVKEQANDLGLVDGFSKQTRVRALDSLIDAGVPDDLWDKLLWVRHFLLSVCSFSSTSSVSPGVFPWNILPSGDGWPAGILRPSKIKDKQAKADVTAVLVECKNEIKSLFSSLTGMRIRACAEIAELLDPRAGPPHCPADSTVRPTFINDPFPSYISDNKSALSAESDARMVNDLVTVHRAASDVLLELRVKEGLHDHSDVSDSAEDLLLARCPRIASRWYPREMVSALEALDDRRPWRDDHIHTAFSICDNLLEESGDNESDRKEIQLARDDLSRRWETLLEIRRRFRAFIIDEAQDNSNQQWRLLARLWGERQHKEGDPDPPDTPWQPTVCWVGDQKQSIYGFRQAQVSGMARYTEHLRAINEHEYASEQRLLMKPALRRRDSARDPRLVEISSFISGLEYVNHRPIPEEAWVAYDRGDDMRRLASKDVLRRSQGHIDLVTNYRTTEDLLKTMNEWWVDLFDHRHNLFEGDWYASAKGLRAARTEENGRLEWLLPISTGGAQDPTTELTESLDPFNLGSAAKNTQLENALIAARIRALIDGRPTNVLSHEIGPTPQGGGGDSSEGEAESSLGEEIETSPDEAAEASSEDRAEISPQVAVETSPEEAAEVQTEGVDEAAEQTEQTEQGARADEATEQTEQAEQSAEVDETAEQPEQDAQVDETAEQCITTHLIEIPAVEKIAPRDIMVLMPTRTHMDDLIRRLDALGVPALADQEGGLLEQPVVQALAALVQLVAQPDNVNRAARLGRTPLIGFNDLQLENYIADRKGGRDLLARLQKHAVSDSQRALFARWKSLADSKRMMQLLEETLDHSDLLLAHPGAVDRQYAEQFLALVRSQMTEAGGDAVLLASRLTKLASVNGKLLPGEAMPPSNAVRVMTIHGSKGLQSKVVIVCGLFSENQSNLGMSFRDNVLISGEMFAARPKPWKSRDDIDSASWRLSEQILTSQVQAEARRLFYVACTRVKDLLILAGGPDNCSLETTTGTIGIDWDYKPKPKFGWMWLESLRQASRRDGLLDSHWLLEDDATQSVPLPFRSGGAISIQIAEMLNTPNLAPGELPYLPIYHHPDMLLPERVVYSPLVRLNRLALAGRLDVVSEPQQETSRNGQRKIRIAPHMIDAANLCLRRHWLSHYIGLDSEAINLPITNSSDVASESQSQPEGTNGKSSGGVKRGEKASKRGEDSTEKSAQRLPNATELGLLFHRLVELGIPNPGVGDGEPTTPLPEHWLRTTKDHLTDPLLIKQVLEEMSSAEIDNDATTTLLVSMAEALRKGSLGKKLGCKTNGKTSSESSNPTRVEALRTEWPFNIHLEIDLDDIADTRWTPHGERVVQTLTSVAFRFDGVCDLVVCETDDSGNNTIRAIDLKSSESLHLLDTTGNRSGTLFEEVVDPDDEESRNASERKLLDKHKFQLYLYHLTLCRQEEMRKRLSLPAREVVKPAILVAATGRLITWTDEEFAKVEEDFWNLLKTLASVEVELRDDEVNFPRLARSEAAICRSCPYHMGAVKLCGPAPSATADTVKSHSKTTLPAEKPPSEEE